MKTRFLTISAILAWFLFSLAFGSCKDDEPDYPIDCDHFMSWSYNGEDVRYIEDFYLPNDTAFTPTPSPDGTTLYNYFHAYINVDPFEESSYTFVCYDTYFTKVKFTSFSVSGHSLTVTDENPQVINGDWFTIDLNGMELTVSFKPNDTVDERNLVLGTNAADVGVLGYGFTFYQAAQEKVGNEEAEE